MGATLAVKPVAMNQVAVGVEAAEKRVRQDDFPGISLDFFPAYHRFGTGDDDRLAGGRLIDDALLVGRAAARRSDALTVHPGMHADHIACLGHISCSLDMTQRGGESAGVVVLTTEGDVEFGCIEVDQHERWQ